jgi:SSS family solute:Na+ symporter
VTLAGLDVAIIVGYLAVVIGIGVYFARRASRGLTDYFAAGRTMPWYMVGTSMVATTLAADTPIGITELIREGGLAGAWYGWAMALGTVTSAVFFAKLWRRAGVLTDAELVELRYSGRPAALLRGFRAAYLGLPINCIMLGWVIFAMVEIVEVTTGLPGRLVLPVLLGIALLYTTASGLWGVVATDAFQMIVAVVGLTILAVVAVAHAGGLDALERAIPAGSLDLVPGGDSATLPLEIFLVYLSMQWWATRNADGGEYIGLKLFTARSVPDAQLAMLWYAVCEYVLKMWPIIVAALASLALYPNDTDHHSIFPRLIADHLPIGLRGLLVASLLAAFLSTVDTHLSWGASYLVNDVYKRFLRPGRSERHYVQASRLAMVLICLCAAAVSQVLTSVADTWRLLVAVGAGQGLVVMLRWYWWRISAWSEISAMVASAIATIVAFQIWPGDHYAARLIAVVATSTAVWLAVTFLAPPEPTARLAAFVDQVRPRGGWWGPVADRVTRTGAGRDLVAWLCGAGFVYSATFAVAYLLFGPRLAGLALAAVAAGFAAATLRLLHGGRDA